MNMMQGSSQQPVAAATIDCGSPSFAAEKAGMLSYLKHLSPLMPPPSLQSQLSMLYTITPQQITQLRESQQQMQVQHSPQGVQRSLAWLPCNSSHLPLSHTKPRRKARRMPMARW